MSYDPRFDSVIFSREPACIRETSFGRGENMPVSVDFMRCRLVFTTLVACVGIFLWFFTPLVCNSWAVSYSEFLYQEGLKALNQGRYENAERCWRSSLHLQKG